MKKARRFLCCITIPRLPMFHGLLTATVGALIPCESTKFPREARKSHGVVQVVENSEKKIAYRNPHGERNSDSQRKRRHSI
ncbi:hypothetical protein B0H13DRAFT_2125627 [Mycena leptocephala]|nr:hypothetical protein B0H13DRAFT_2125627 [Mycena leptocephala]